MSNLVTLLDAAHAAVSADPENEALRLRFFERLADGEMVLLLEREAEGDSLEPRILELEDGPVKSWSLTGRSGWKASPAGSRPMRSFRGG